MPTDSGSESDSTPSGGGLPEWHQEEIDTLIEFFEKYDTISVVSIAGIPSRQLQTMRSDLPGNAEVRISRNSLIKSALTKIGGDVKGLTEYVTGEVGVIGTNDNPFELFRLLQKSKSPAPINAGEVAPDDIVIPEGDTGIEPSPFVGELQSVGVAARIMEGSIHVTEDSVVAKEGEKVSEDVANVLEELGIEPKKVGLSLEAVYADGTIYEAEELAEQVDEDSTTDASAHESSSDASQSAMGATFDAVYGRTMLGGGVLSLLLTVTFSYARLLSLTAFFGLTSVFFFAVYEANTDSHVLYTLRRRTAQAGFDALYQQVMVLGVVLSMVVLLVVSYARLVPMMAIFLLTSLFFVYSYRRLEVIHHVG